LDSPSGVQELDRFVAFAFPLSLARHWCHSQNSISNDKPCRCIAQTLSMLPGIARMLLE
jgi:hypothetical protein